MPPSINLQITKTAIPATFERGGTGQYNIVVSNPAGGTPSSGAVTVFDTIPPDLILLGVTPPAGWTCPPITPVSCTRENPIAPGESFTIVLNISVPADSPVATVTNIATLRGGGDPDGATATVTTPIVGADLRIAKVQPTPFARGESGTFTLTVTNNGTAATHGTVTVTDTLPTDLRPTGPSTVNGWACAVSGQNVSCSRSDSLAAGASYLPITLAVTVAQGVSADLTNTAAVSGGGDITPVNNTSTIPVPIQNSSQSVPDLRITKSHTDSVSQGGPLTFTIGVNNVSVGLTTAEVVVTDPLPGILSVTGATGDGWLCSVAQTVRCTRPGIGANQSVPITIHTTILPEAVGTFTNTATLSGGGDLSLPRTASDTFTVNDQRQPNLTVTKTHTPSSFTPGQNATFSIVVTNQCPVQTSGTCHGRRHDSGRPHAGIRDRGRLDLQHPRAAHRLHASRCNRAWRERSAHHDCRVGCGQRSIRREHRDGLRRRGHQPRKLPT